MKNLNVILGKISFLLAVFVVFPNIAKAKNFNFIKRIDVVNSGSNTEITLYGSKPAVFSAFREDTPPKVVLELPNTKISSYSKLKIDSWSVSRVFVLKSGGKGLTARLVIYQARSGTYKLKSIGNKIKVVIIPDQKAPPGVEKAAQKLAQLRKTARLMSKRLYVAEKRANLLKAQINGEQKKLNITKKDQIRILNELKQAKREITLLKQRKNSIINDLQEAKIRMKLVRKEEKLAKFRMRKISVQTAKLKAKQLRLLNAISTISDKLDNYRKQKITITTEIKNIKSNLSDVSKRSRNYVKFKKRLRKMNKKLFFIKKHIRLAEKSKNSLQRFQKQEIKKLTSLKNLLKLEKTKLNRTYAKLKKITSELEQKRNSLAYDLKELLKKRNSLAQAAKKEKTLKEKYTRARIKAQKLHKKTLSLIKVEAKRAKRAELKRKQVEQILQKEKQLLQYIRSAKQEEKNTLEKLKKLKARHLKMLKEEKRAFEKYKKTGNKQKLAKLRKARVKRLKELAKLTNKANKLEKRLKYKSVVLSRINSKLKNAKVELKNAKNRYELIQNELVNLSSERDNARKILRQTKATLESIRLKFKQEVRKFAKLKKRSGRKLGLLNKITAKLENKKKKLATIERKKYLKTLEIASLRKNFKMWENKLEGKKQEVSKLETKKKNLLNQLKKLNHRKVSLQKEIYKNKKIYKNLNSRKSRAYNKELVALKILETKKRKLQERLAKLQALETKKSSRNKVYSDKIKVLTTIKSVDFIDSPWSHRVVMKFTGKEVPEVLTKHKGLITLKLENTRFINDLRRRIDTSAYHGPIKQFVTWNKISGNTVSALLNIFINGKRKIRITRRRGKITILLPKTVAEVRRYKRTKYTPPSKIAGYMQSTDYAVSTSLNTKIRKYRHRRYRSRGRRYSGRYVDLDFKDADLHDVIRLMAEVWGKNVVIPDNVKGTVSIKLTNVRVDRAFDVVLKSKGLSWRYEGGNIIRIITLEQIQQERQEIMARNKTKVTLTKTETRLIPINYADVKDIAKTIEKNVKSSRGKVSYDKRTNVLIYVDVPSKLTLAEKLVKSLDLPTPQVQIEARIIEAQSTFLREIGVQWGGSMLAGASTGNPTGLVFPSSIGMAGGNMDQKTNTTGISSAGAANPDFAINLPAATGQGAGGAVGMTLGSLAGAVNINLRLSAMEEIGHIRSIAAPKITTMDNTEAKISQGVEIPYPQSSAQGNTVIMKQAVLSLAVTPHVTNNNYVKLKIKVTKDEPDETHRGADGSLGISKKSAETELLVKSGDTAVIGGIYKRQSTLVYRKVPWFADIPVFGWLFKNQYKKDERSEILIFITPRVLNRSAILNK